MFQTIFRMCQFCLQLQTNVPFDCKNFHPSDHAIAEYDNNRLDLSLTQVYELWFPAPNQRKICN